MLHSKKIFGHYQRIARKQGTISYLIHLRAMEYSKSHVMNMKFCVGYARIKKDEYAVKGWR